MINKFIIDKEINLNENDFLKTKIYANNLSKIIKNTESNKVFTIGLFGNWGTGKSSIIKTSEQDFDEKKIKFINYDAWQYVNDSFRRMFLHKLREELRYEETDLMKRFYENESTDIGNKYQLSSTRVLLILGSLIFILFVLAFIPFQIDNKISVFSILTLLGLFITIFSGAFHQLKISVTKPHLFAPEQFEECYKEIVTNSLSKANKILKWVKGDNSIRNLEKLVVVIDNIDRCSSDVAYNLLTDIKTFLSSEPYSIVFVIPVDDEALKKHIVKTSTINSDCDKEKEEFLRKFFNVTIRIKPYEETDMYSFAKQICEQNGINFKPETISIASKEYAKNPRRIIQLFNNLLAEMNYYDQDFAIKNESLICCLLIIREEYFDYYKSLINSPSVFNKEYSGTEDNVKRFVRIFQNYIGIVPISDLNMVLLNSHHQFDNIDNDLKDAIETFNAEVVSISWGDKKEQAQAVDYIYDRLDSSIKNNLIETELVALFDLLAQINISNPIDKHITKRIDEKIFPHLPILISKTKNHVNLCKYALLRESQNDKKLKATLIEFSSRSENQQKDNYWASLINAVLNVFKDKNTSDALSSTYTIFHNSIDTIDFSEEQFNYLLSEQYVQEKIKNLPIDKTGEILLDTETKEYQIVKWLFENKNNIAEGTYGHLFTKVVGASTDGSRMKDRSVAEIVQILEFMNLLLNLISDKKLTTQPQTIYTLIVSDRHMIAPQYVGSQNLPVQSPYYENKNFIDECISGNVHIQVIIDFIINIYRITDNKTNIKVELAKLLKIHSINEQLMQLVEKGFILQPILSLIFDNINDFSDGNSIKLLIHCFINPNKDITPEKIKTKLNSLLTYAHANNSNEVFILLEGLSNQDIHKNLLTTLIIEKDSVFINSLPSNLLKLAVGSFTKDNYNDYSNNFEFLSVIIQNGNNTQKGYVVKVLTNKIDTNQDLEHILKLVESMDNIPTFDKSGLLFSHLDDFQRQNKDNVSPEINDRINELKKKTK